MVLTLGDRGEPEPFIPLLPLLSCPGDISLALLRLPDDPALARLPFTGEAGVVVLALGGEACDPGLPGAALGVRIV